MPMTDPIADMLTRIRNANRIKKKAIAMPASAVKVGIAQILKEEGFIHEYSVEPGEPRSSLSMTLKYTDWGECVIRHIERVSKPGRRVYAKSTELKPVLKGMGIQIISTPQGMKSDRTARKDNVGGEILCKVY